MSSLGNQLFFFFLLVLSPQIQARQNKFFSFFTHFKTINNVKDPQPLTTAPTPAPLSAPTPAPLSAPTQEPSAAPEIGTSIPSGPAPEPEFLDNGNSYGLYGMDSTKETPTTFENELLNEDFNDNKSYKKGYPQTNFHNNYNNEVYTKTYNSEEYNNNYVNGYERKGEGMSDTRFMENGKYYYNVNNEKDNYNLNGYESERGSNENEGYSYGKNNQYPNEFDTMEEYEKQQEAQGYTYTP
ncbi:uncharacterized protein [Cicer arietinum]|uniref:Protein E6 n=1 Tax=Cicer arietinum TaxID=3827 RepID=A0A1S2XCI9_CICAR|nr:protein E6 [Cicer arietinum]